MERFATPARVKTFVYVHEKSGVLWPISHYIALSTVIPQLMQVSNLVERDSRLYFILFFFITETQAKSESEPDEIGNLFDGVVDLARQIN
ncbi:hypothetical protein TNCV_4438951 [Trichonephila clavipes]|nr:hypothetical protein TNCV_4438951 [Trichonephila clavipes]